jgi:hydroxymethylbilane synthase
MRTSPDSWTIATRESRLAMWQAEHVQQLLASLSGQPVHLLGMTTLGDQILDRSLSKVGGKGLFVKELETALADQRADLAVHSLKDVPMELPEGFHLTAVMQREDPRDALVSNQYDSLDALPQGGVVGTSSLRRLVQLKALRPDLQISPLRGNLDTRLRKLDEGQYAAIVLAAAGLKRLGLSDRIRQVLDTDTMLPAAGQGALGLETMSAQTELHALLAPLNHLPTLWCTSAERQVSRALGGSCSMPLAAYACMTNADTLQLTALLGHPVRAGLLRASMQAPVQSVEQAIALGQQVADQLVSEGARQWLADLP